MIYSGQISKSNGTYNIGRKVFPEQIEEGFCFKHKNKNYPEISYVTGFVRLIDNDQDYNVGMYKGNVRHGSHKVVYHTGNSEIIYYNEGKEIE